MTWSTKEPIKAMVSFKGLSVEISIPANFAMSRISFVPPALTRSEERRVGKECRSRWSPYH